MSEKVRLGRRDFIKGAALASAAVVGGIPIAGLAQQQGVTEVSPVEDLMREHGALNRIMLIFEEDLRRLHDKKPIEPDLVREPATIVQEFIQRYHEKLEENYLFPRLKRAGRLPGVVETLLAQHEAGRRLMAVVATHSTGEQLRKKSEGALVSDALRQFIRMYRPHEAWEDTVVFPEFKKLVTPAEYRQLGEQFEEQEHRLFGREGYQGVLARIAAIEKRLGIYDLAKFTPAA